MISTLQRGGILGTLWVKFFLYDFQLYIITIYCDYEMIIEERIEINPEICHGKPVIKGTRIMISIILEWLEAGKSFNEIIDAYPSLTKQDISAVIKYARKLIEDEKITVIS
jgi:uncharacterized protein (DUF433 family)